LEARLVDAAAHRFLGYAFVGEARETKGFLVDEDELIAWQDVLDQVAAGRPGDAACPFCKHRPLTIEDVDFATRISCSRCNKFIQGKFA
jgi:hypothetical protein